MTTGRMLRAAVLAWLVVRAWIALLAFDLARPAGFAPVCRRLGAARANGRRPLASPQDIVWAVDEACVWYVKRAACLQRSFVAARLLRRHGFAAEMVIGCRPLPFESHAWVELDGCVVNDLPQYQRAFAVLNRF
jgi:hypothetical protein